MENPVKYAEGFNFGPNPADTLTVEEMTQMATEIWGGGTFVFPQLTHQPHEAGLLSLDITKASKVLGWQPRLNARQALEMTLEWYKRFYQEGATSIMELMEEQMGKFGIR